MIRLFAKIRTNVAVVLIDSGSTHNFISERLASILQLPVTPIKTFDVKVANGKTFKC